MLKTHVDRQPQLSTLPFSYKLLPQTDKQTDVQAIPHELNEVVSA